MREGKEKQSVLSGTVGFSHSSPAPLEDENSWIHLLTQPLRKRFEIWHVMVLEGKEASEMEGFEVETKWMNGLIWKQKQLVSQAQP